MAKATVIPAEQQLALLAHPGLSIFDYKNLVDLGYQFKSHGLLNRSSWLKADPAGSPGAFMTLQPYAMDILQEKLRVMTNTNKEKTNEA